MAEKMGREREAQSIIDGIVGRMVAKGYPVEATNKNGHRPDHIPASTYGGWTDKLCPFTGSSYFEHNLASALIGGWHSKAALQQLIIEVRAEPRALDEATHDR